MFTQNSYLKFCFFLDQRIQLTYLYKNNQPITIYILDQTYVENPGTQISTGKN